MGGKVKFNLSGSCDVYNGELLLKDDLRSFAQGGL